MNDIQEKPPIAPDVQPAKPVDDRFFRLAMHEEQILNSRSNIFLVVESILLVFAHNVASYPEFQMQMGAGAIWSASFLDVVVIAGLVITAIWALMCYRQDLDLEHAVKAMRADWPEMVDAYAPISGLLKRLSLFLLIWGLPAVFALLWVAFLIFPAPPPGAN
ncbi:MAG TPA: hypothetical protein VNH64_05930 [Parvularculaceae bacterium]|nr:hypothetical protein [Parvularculaceae bacterium]